MSGVRASKTRRPVPWVAWALIAVVAATALTAATLVGSYQKVRIPQSGSRQTILFYSRPCGLLPGSRCDLPDLEARCKRLGYRAAADSLEVGQFRMTPSGAEIYLRPFRYPEYRSHAGRVRVHVTQGKVDSLIAVDLLTAEECKLEPERIASFEGSTGAFQNPLRLETTPTLLLDALIAIEDRRFYQHPGIDPIGSLRALWYNLRFRDRAQGGSTLTQQLARSLYLHNQKTVTRKLQEAVYAIGLELRYSKKEILEAYLNAIYWGAWGTMEIRGAREAARYYLGCELEEADDAGIALLVSLIRSPNAYSPYSSPQRAQRRRDMVLRLLHDRGVLNEARTRAGFDTPLPTERPPERIADPSYFLDAARREIMRRAPDGTLGRSGITVFTTLDPLDQTSVVRTLREGIADLESTHRRLRRRNNPLQAAVVVLDSGTGEVSALVGGRDYIQGPWNRAVDAQRQPGSLFKPFVYLAAFRKGQRGDGGSWTPATVLRDEPVEIPGVRERDWPQNYDRRFRGEVTVREAVEQSINVPTALAGYEVGIERVAEVARDLGILSPLDEFPSLALGASEVNLLEITGAYGGLAAGGIAKRPRLVTAIVDEKGRSIPLAAVEDPPGVAPEDAYLVTQLLKGVIQRGTGKAARRLLTSGEVAGKSGTTDLYRDAWFIGYTPRRAVGVWVGFDRDELTGLSGSGAALPIWERVIEATRIRSGDGTFPKPEGIVTVPIDPETGLLATGECPTFFEESFRAGTEPTTECTLHKRGILGRLKGFSVSKLDRRAYESRSNRSRPPPGDRLGGRRRRERYPSSSLEPRDGGYAESWSLMSRSLGGISRTTGRLSHPLLSIAGCPVFSRRIRSSSSVHSSSTSARSRAPSIALWSPARARARETTRS